MIVIVDTNLARNENSFSRLLGNRSQLEKIAATARLIIPEVVIDEIVAQKRLAFQKELAVLRRSGVLKLTVSPEEVLGSLSFDNIERKIRNDKSIPYTPLPLPPANYVLPKLYEWALSHKAPFEEKSDKGFKDACIVASIEHYLESTEIDEGVVLCTDDNRMASYFKGRQDIRVENDLSKAAGEETSNSIPENMGTVEEQRPKKTVVKLSIIDSMISNLSNSPSFQTTHAIVKELSSHSQSLSGSQELLILKAALSNDQVSWILTDEDICDFIKPIFLRHKEELTDGDYKQFVDCFNLVDEREDERGEPFFTTTEKRVFRTFVNAVEDHTSAKMVDTAIQCEPGVLLPNLNNLLDSYQVDTHLPSIRPLTSILFDGYVETKPGSIPVSVVSDFARMLAKASPRKQEAISLNLAAHLRDIEDEIPF